MQHPMVNKGLDQKKMFPGRGGESINVTGIFYAETGTVVEYLRDRTGQKFMQEMLRRLQHGETMEAIVGALRPDGAANIGDLEKKWRAYVEAHS